MNFFDGRIKFRLAIVFKPTLECVKNLLAVAVSNGHDEWKPELSEEVSDADDYHGA